MTMTAEGLDYKNFGVSKKIVPMESGCVFPAHCARPMSSPGQLGKWRGYQILIQLSLPWNRCLVTVCRIDRILNRFHVLFGSIKHNLKLKYLYDTFAFLLVRGFCFIICSPMSKYLRSFIYAFVISAWLLRTIYNIYCSIYSKSIRILYKKIPNSLAYIIFTGGHIHLHRHDDFRRH